MLKFATLIPIYKSKLEDYEAKALLRLAQVIENDAYLIAPEELNVEEYFRLNPKLKVLYFDKKHFENIPSYNRLLLSDEFYLPFLNMGYDWMLLHQLDAFLFHGNVEPFLNSKYDYFGAPWIGGQLLSPHFKNAYLLKLFGKRVFVGNGGFSLRRISSVLSLLKQKKSEALNWPSNEDGFFSYYGSFGNLFTSCPLEVAKQFAFEKEPKALLKDTNGVLPFGCHGFNKYEIEFYNKHLNELLQKLPLNS